MTGYLLALAAASLYALGGVIAKTAFQTGIEPATLSEWRILFGFLAFFVLVGLPRPGLLRLRRADLPLVAAFGVIGIAGVQLAYYEAIARLPISVALVIEYTAPLLVLAWMRATGRAVGSRLWIAAGLTLGGCFFVVGAYDEALRGVNGLGALIAFADAVFYAAYLLIAERLVARYRSEAILVWGFAAALVAWSLRRPPWLLPWTEYSGAQWLLILGVVVVATVLPYFCAVGAVRRLAAARVGITLTAEPVVAAVCAWLLISERLDPPQLAGGAVVIAGIVVAQTAPARAR